jgi:hypothetical protein
MHGVDRIPVAHPGFDGPVCEGEVAVSCLPAQQGSTPYSPIPILPHTHTLPLSLSQTAGPTTSKASGTRWGWTIALKSGTPRYAGGEEEE